MKEKMTTAQAQLEVEAQVKRFEIAIGNIAAAARDDIIKPFCDRHKVRFDSGMGAYAFFNQHNEEMSGEWERGLHLGRGQAPWEFAPADYPDIYRLLNIEVGTATALFNYMEDYDGS
jgi:hypothetical protein